MRKLKESHRFPFMEIRWLPRPIDRMQKLQLYSRLSVKYLLSMSLNVVIFSYQLFIGGEFKLLCLLFQSKEELGPRYGG